MNDELEDDSAENEVSEDLQHEAKEWLDKIQQREKEFEDGWWKSADSSAKVYTMEKTPGGQTSPSTGDTVYNILYSNTEVLRPSLYSSTPKPDVRPRYTDMDIKPLPEVLNRFLTVVSDPANPGHESFDGAMNETVLSSLVAAMGYSRIRHYPERKMPICVESGHYKSLIWGKARKWAKLPWIAFRHELTKEELFSQFDVPEQQQKNYVPPERAEGEKSFGTVVYELWIKAERKIYFICPDWTPKLIKQAEDTLQLEGFFPLPGILCYTAKPGLMEPNSLYEYYRNQAQELDRVSVRLNKILAAIRVRGVYHSLLGEELKALLSADDTENALLPAGDSGFLQQLGGFDKAIWMLPVEKLILVATQLYQAREAIKQVIYELTGISDIIRGSNVASETATASDLKNKWGTIRLRMMQIATANYVRDLYRLSVDAAVNVMGEDAWKAITQLPIQTSQEKALLQQTIAQQGQILQTPGLPPEVMQQQAQRLQQMQQQAQGPSWQEILQRIRDDQNRAFTINVQTSSTIDLDTASDKQEVGEFMNAMGQLMAGLQPLGQLGPQGLEVIKATLIAVCNRFKFGASIVEAIKKLAFPQPQGPQEDPAKKAEAEATMKALEIDQQVKQAEASARLQEIQRKEELAKAQMQLAMEQLAAEREMLQIKVASARLKAEAAKATIAAKPEGGANAAVRN